MCVLIFEERVVIAAADDEIYLAGVTDNLFC